MYIDREEITISKLKYGVPFGVSGVYSVTCKTTGKTYVGASVLVSSRLSTHFGRDARKYTHREFYQDITKYGLEGFECKLLEECPKENLLEREQFWYDKLKPEYNNIRPVEEPFLDDYVREQSRLKSQTPEKIAERKALFNSPEYVELFRNMHTEKMKPVTMTDLEGNYIDNFISMQAASRWLDENTVYTGKNKTSKIKEVADGERRMAYGFKFYYTNKSVETIQ